MGDVNTVKDLDAGLIESALGTNAAAIAVIAQKRTREYGQVKLAADAMASTASADTTLPWCRVAYAGKVVAVKITSSAALTGDPTNNAVITVSKRDAAGANLTTVAAITTTVSWVAGADVTLALTAANIFVVAGGTLSVAITKGGAGVVVPICALQYLVEDAA